MFLNSQLRVGEERLWKGGFKMRLEDARNVCLVYFYLSDD
jgi:hypothetical protein